MISEYEFPFMRSVRVFSIADHSWAIKTQLEKPRYIFVLQINRKNNMITHKTYLDNCKLTNVKLHLNSEFFPYADLNLNFDKRRTYFVRYVSDIFTIYFRISYYQISKESSKTLFKTDSFRNLFLLVIIYCSRQNESVKSGIVDMRLEFKWKKMYQ